MAGGLAPRSPNPPWLVMIGTLVGAWANRSGAFGFSLGVAVKDRAFGSTVLGFRFPGFNAVLEEGLNPVFGLSASAPF